MPALVMVKNMSIAPQPFRRGGTPPTVQEVINGSQSYLYVMNTFLDLSRRVSTHIVTKSEDKPTVLIAQLNKAMAELDSELAMWTELDLWSVLNATRFDLPKDSPWYPQLSNLAEELYRAQGEVRLILGAIAAVD